MKALSKIRCRNRIKMFKKDDIIDKSTIINLEILVVE